MICKSNNNSYCGGTSAFSRFFFWKRPHLNVAEYLKYVEHLLVLVSKITDYISISAFGSLDCAPVTTNPVTIMEGIKKYKSIVNYNKKRKTMIL